MYGEDKPVSNGIVPKLDGIVSNGVWSLGVEEFRRLDPHPALLYLPGLSVDRWPSYSV